jgi:hypothetical protein
VKKFNYNKSHALRDSGYVGSEARTLSPDYVGNNKSGWQIKAEIHEDYFEWVNYFEAFHPDFGLVFGDFELEVTASSDATITHFLKYHPFEEWDYYDI